MTDNSDPVTTAGMGTGSDAGAPGEQLPEPPLDADEQQLLTDLQRPADGDPVEAVEDSPEVVRAAEDDAALPALGGGGNGDETPFRSPAD